MAEAVQAVVMRAGIVVRSCRKVVGLLGSRPCSGQGMLAGGRSKANQFHVGRIVVNLPRRTPNRKAAMSEIGGNNRPEYKVKRAHRWIDRSIGIARSSAIRFGGMHSNIRTRSDRAFLASVSVQWLSS